MGVIYMPNCMSCHKAIVVITGRAHCLHIHIYIYTEREKEIQTEAGWGGFEDMEFSKVLKKYHVEILGVN